MVLQSKKSCCGFSLQTGTLIIGSLSLAMNVRVFTYDLEIGGYLPSLMLTFPMIICSALLIVVAVKNRLPKLLIPWIILSVLEMFVILFICYLAMIIAGQAFQPKSIEKFLLITFSILSVTAFLLFRTWFIVFSYYRELTNRPKKYPQPEDLP
uniref:Uncharacterized protein n=1 Tax=Daphnia galeata TaxID=27404 RepID=A0A8J2RXU7_9CRUS|nr:unnamed protein product [Daphnia galeata]